MSHLENLDSIWEQQRSVVYSGRLRDIHVRRERLDVLYRTMKKWEPQLLEALKIDLGKSAFEGYSTELGMVYREIREAIRELPKWSRCRRAAGGIAAFPSKGVRIPEPVGQVLIFSPWNYPVQLSLAPLTAALAAGCTCVLKPSRYSEAVSRVLESMLAEAFPEEEVAVV